MVSMVDTGARVKVVRTNGGVTRMVLVCPVMSGYILASSSPEYVNGAVASVFREAFLARARNAVSSLRVIMRNEEAESGSMSLVT